ncbi:flavin reductase like domain-containing protein [Pseudomassariella vexata]|uniref:Flavin reductase like domain-domain-containing protein n=1 Tax=Pseudomassariella vexata TaxID=1141098 RepID=A0A1Y2EIC9_9PEZI|nr:flavin reductase like domain-containing protein [Pseudomassariella vexata]ORY71339.1 flavin reductase like domain-domain-containing protein [Pseudomassariella vexata]
MKKFCSLKQALKSTRSRNSSQDFCARRGTSAPFITRCYSDAPCSNIETEPLAEENPRVARQSPSSQAREEQNHRRPVQIRKTRAPDTPEKLKYATRNELLAVDPEEFRILMRHVPHPVVVLTSVYFPPVRKAALYPQETSPEPVDEIPEDPGTDEAHSSNPWVSQGKTGLNADSLLGAINRTSAAAAGVDPGGISRASKPIPRAMTLSSFTSLSPYPTPKIIFNIGLPSRTFDAILSSGRFNIHVLRDSAMGARLAQHFSHGNATPTGRGNSGHDMGVFEGLGQYGVGVTGLRWVRQWDMLNSLDPVYRPIAMLRTARSQMPVLNGQPVLYVLKCAIARGHQDKPTIFKVGGGDNKHAIVVGDVEGFVPGEPDEKFELKSHEISLAYADREFRTAANPVGTFDKNEATQPRRMKMVGFMGSNTDEGEPSAKAAKIKKKQRKQESTGTKPGKETSIDSLGQIDEVMNDSDFYKLLEKMFQDPRK